MPHTHLTRALNRSDAAITFKDVPSNSWYYSHVQFIANYRYELMVGLGLFYEIQHEGSVENENSKDRGGLHITEYLRKV